jgi:hypothetical protein
MLRAVSDTVSFLHLLDRLTPVLGAVVGFLSALVAFEVQEHRKRSITQNATRRTLLAELRQAELNLSMAVFTASLGAEDVDRGVKEVRWFLDVGLERARFTGTEPLPEQREQLERFRNIPQNEMVAVIQRLPAQQRSRAIEMRLPVLDSFLSSPTLGFSDQETQALSSVHWQLYLLSEEARGMAEMRALTYTVADTVNHSIVVSNLEIARKGYQQRAGVALDTVRVALSVLETGRVARAN